MLDNPPFYPSESSIFSKGSISYSAVLVHTIFKNCCFFLDFLLFYSASDRKTKYHRMKGMIQYVR